MLFVFNKNKIISYFVATSVVAVLFLFSVSIIPNDDVKMIQQIAGGKVVYLECEDKQRLIDFYSRNGFVTFGNRSLDRDETNLSGKYLVQMLKYL